MVSQATRQVPRTTLTPTPTLPGFRSPSSSGVPPAVPPPPVSNDGDGNGHVDSNGEYYNSASDSEDEDSEDEFADEEESVTTSSSNKGKLWDNRLFPEGMKGYSCWDWTNCLAAQEWKCPCLDRRSCISRERLRTEDLLIHRKEQQTSKARSNLRDSARDEMAGHYNASTRSMSRSFVV